MIVASGDAEFSAKDNALSVAGAHVTDLALMLRTGNNEIGGVVTEARSGAPLGDIEVACWTQPNNQRGAARKETTRTDADGVFSFPPRKEYGQALVVASRGDQRAVASSWYSPGNREMRRAQESVVFFTDRAIYRPGQTIHFKGIKCHSDPDKGDYHTVAGSPVKVSLRDPNNKESATLELKTNDRGSFSGSFTAPAGGLLGRFRIIAENLGHAFVSVEEYKRPKFFAEISPPAAAAALGAAVEITGRAEAYTGAPVDGAKVTWRVTRAARWPDWIRWCWWFLPPDDDQEIADGTAVTNADGTYQIRFEALPDAAIDPETEPVFDFMIEVAVTDPSGETREATRTVSVAYTTLRAGLSAPPWLEANKDFALKVRTESHDGEPRPTEGVVRIHALKQPAECPRPPVADNPEEYGILPDVEPVDGPSPVNPHPWPLGEVVKEIPWNAGQGGEVELKVQLPVGMFRAVLETQDANGRKVKAYLGLHAVDAAAAAFPVKMPFFTGVPEAKREPGQTYTLVWGSGYPAARALAEWFKDGRLLKREWSAPGRTQHTFSWQVDEAQRGGLTVQVRQFAMNRIESATHTVEVPWTNKQLALRWERITSKLEPGARETWTAILSGPDGEAAAAEMVATLYDASLDAFVAHRFATLNGLLRTERGIWWREQFSGESESFRQQMAWSGGPRFAMKDIFRQWVPEVMPFGQRGRRLREAPMMLRGVAAGGFGGMADAAPMAAEALFDAAEPRMAAGVDYSFGAVASPAGPPDAPATPKPDLSQVTARANLQETAFFFPHLTTEPDGTVRISFVMPEALTKWRFLGLAHDNDLRSGLLEGETVTSKDLMVQPNPPRFLREGDTLEFTVKITNRSDREQSGRASLALADAATDADLTAKLGVTAQEQDFTVPAGESRTLSWRLTVPDGAGFLRYKAVASSGALSDGEEGWLPVIPRRILVTESMALPIRNAGTKEFRFEKLLASGQSDTLESRFLHLQVASQPAWYAVMALPYLMEFPHECAEQIFNRYYANALASHIARSDPKIKRVFEQWRGTEALDSPLMKNPDLKGILLDETPWLREAQNEAEARRRVGLLFDENMIAEQGERALRKLREMRNDDNRWPWFPGGPGNEYISLYVATGFARLRALGVETDIS
nr:MG2 domain-containing protein [Akkermansiaceae bacterium]